jgi:hypothetical protein
MIEMEPFGATWRVPSAERNTKLRRAINRRESRKYFTEIILECQRRKNAPGKIAYL